MNVKTLRAMALGMLLSCSAVQADDFFIEIDYMTDTDHDHRPSAAVINAVVQMFACQGHNLTIVVDDQIPHRDVLRRDSNCSSFFGFNNGAYTSYGYIKAQHFDRANWSDPWHYCIFAHQYQNKDSNGNCVTSGSSGLATGGEDFIVTMGSFSGQVGTLFDQAATLAHEFGHNLGLSHCGTQYCGGDTDRADYVGPYVSNMPSVMAYRYQLAGVREQMLCRGMIRSEAKFKNIDYSHGLMCSQNENALDERRGSGMIWTDWNGDGAISSNLAKDISGNRNWCNDGNRTTVSDYNEWGNIVDGALLSRSNKSADKDELEKRRKVFEFQPCIDAELAAEVREEFDKAGCPSCSQATLSTESCLSGENVYVGDFFFLELGSCVLPYDSVKDAHDSSAWNSIYYLKPKTYNEADNILLDRRSFWTCDRTDGTALIR